MPDIQLPIVLEPLHAESAMGFVLRCAHANGTNLHGLRRAIGMRRRWRFHWNAYSVISMAVAML